MNTYDWAKNELKLARENEIKQCKKETDYQPGNEDYGLMCYDAAERLLDVFEEQGHSGYSAIVVCSIFERLVKGKPLTPVTDEEDQWRKAYTFKKDPVKSYQHKRMSSLFKYVAPDGTVSYYDIDRIRAYDQNSSNFSTTHVNDIVSEYFPIKFPYIGEEIKVRLNDFDNIETVFGLVDARHIIDATKNGIEHVFIDRYFMRSKDDYKWKEIDVFTYRDIIKTNILKSKEENKNG